RPRPAARDRRAPRALRQGAARRGRHQAEGRRPMGGAGESAEEDMIRATLRLAPVLALSLAIAGRAPARDQVGDLIAHGRELLESGRAEEAQKLFDQAAVLDKSTLRTRTWVLRSWMDQGRINDSLDAIDELSKKGAKGVEIDYLYGM